MSSEARSEGERLIWLDSLRLVAGVSMVGLHSTADPQGQPFAAYEASERIVPMLVRAVIYTARTELFLIISVFLLLMALERRPKSYGTTIAIQARRLLVPFVFWTVFYAFYNLIKAESFGYLDSALARLSDPVEWAGFLLLGDVKYHMHFIPTLFGLILFYPFFRIGVRYPWIGLSILAFLLVKRDLDAFLYPTFWGDDLLPWAVRGVKIFTYVGYGMVAASFLGIWRSVSATERERFVGVVLLLGAMLFLLKLVATWKTVETGRWPFDYTAGYWADFLMPVVLFAIAMCLGHKRWPRILSTLAPYSFGIYLCHPIFLDLVEISIRDLALTPTQQVLIKISVTLSATSVFVGLLSRTPMMAWTIGLGPLPWLEPRRAMG